MTTKITESPIEADRERQIGETRANVLCGAEVQGVKAFTTLEDFAGDPEMTADFDVDEFLRQCAKIPTDRTQLETVGSYFIIGDMAECPTQSVRC
jgi:hypothetical protein